MDRAFGFYYPDDLEAMAAAGAEIVPFDTLRDARLPEVDALFLGGGFPEVLAAELEANAPMRAQVREAVESGMPVHAECGGLMYLARSIEWHGRRYAMAGALPGEVVMHERPVGRGYVVLVETAEHPWPRGRREEDPPAAGRVQRSSHRANSPLAQGARGAVSAAVRAHEFHHSSLEGLPADVRFAYRVTRGHGVDGAHDGIVWRNTLATYAHLRSVRADDWAARFVAFARACRARAAGGALAEETQ